MSLRLEIVSQHRRSLGEHGVKTFGADGGTIGRSLETDWSLPDQYRFVSSRHASIDFRSGAYYIVDTSKNGVYVNDSRTPVGRGHPQRLFSGDRIRIGDYEISVTIDEFDDTREVLAGLTHVDPVDLRQQVEAPDPTGCELLGGDVITGVGIELILEEDAADTQTPLDVDTANDTQTPLDADGDLRMAPDVDDDLRTASDVDGDTQTPLDVGADGDTRTPLHADASAATPIDPAVAAFCRGAGLEPRALTADQAQALMLRVGEVTRELVAGLLGSLQLRSRQKADLRQSGTTIQPRENNILKFSPNTDEALNRLLLEQSDFYLSPCDAVRSAFADIRQHQQIVMKSMHTALIEYLQHGTDDLPPAFLDALARVYGQEAASAEPVPQRRDTTRRREAG
jgi:type VI secretion system FHA domain protein